jgi:cob(I)alamin adenosyltransferase
MGLFGAKKALDFEMVTTKGGDGGKTALYSGEFLPKDDAHFRVLGDVDELSSWLGVCRHAGLAAAAVRQIHGAQQLLYRLMSVVATDPRNAEAYAGLKPPTEADVVELEHWEKAWLDQAAIEPRFVIPGEANLASAQLDYARTLARRAERSLVGFIHEIGAAQSNAPDLYLCQKYLNRLSDWLFVLARHADQHAPGR